VSKLLCQHCGRPRGQHQAFSYNCPIDGAGFDGKQYFALRIERLTCDDHMAKALLGKPLPIVEQEIARRVVKQFEHVFECYDLGRTYTQEEILSGIELIRKGYDL
jgi:hypothetical protein